MFPAPHTANAEWSFSFTDKGNPSGKTLKRSAHPSGASTAILPPPTQRHHGSPTCEMGPCIAFSLGTSFHQLLISFLYLQLLLFSSSLLYKCTSAQAPPPHSKKMREEEIKHFFLIKCTLGWRTSMNPTQNNWQQQQVSTPRLRAKPQNIRDKKKTFETTRGKNKLPTKKGPTIRRQRPSQQQQWKPIYTGRQLFLIYCLLSEIKQLPS